MTGTPVATRGRTCRGRSSICRLCGRGIIHGERESYLRVLRAGLTSHACSTGAGLPMEGSAMTSPIDGRVERLVLANLHDEWQLQLRTRERAVEELLELGPVAGDPHQRAHGVDLAVQV